MTSTSLLGVWNGVSLLFADWTRIIRMPHGARPGFPGAIDGAEAATAATGYVSECADAACRFAVTCFG